MSAIETADLKELWRKRADEADKLLNQLQADLAAMDKIKSYYMKRLPPRLQMLLSVLIGLSLGQSLTRILEALA
jgi:hypothetical protein